MTNAQKKTIEREFYRYRENKQLAGKFLDDFVNKRPCKRKRGERSGEWYHRCYFERSGRRRPRP